MRYLIVIVTFILLSLPVTSNAQCNTESFVDFEAGTDGANVTTALLASSTRGYTPQTWSITQPSSTSIKFVATGNQPLYTPTGTLCGDSTNYPAGAGSLGVEFVGTGITGANEIEIGSGSLPSALRTTHFRESIWFCFNLPFSNGSINYDIFDVHPLGGNFTAVNVHSLGTSTTTYLNMETGDGNGATTIPIDFTSTHGASCTFPNGFPDPSAPWYKLVITLGVSGGEPHSLFVYNTKGGLVGSVSLASTNTQAATSVYIAGGGVTSTVPVGENIYVDSWQLATFSTPLDTPSCSGASPSWTSTPDLTSVQACLNNAISGDTVNVTSGVATWNTGAISRTIPGSLTLAGATACTVGCAAGSEGVGLAFTDNTKVQVKTTSSNALNVNGCTTTKVFRLTGFSFTVGSTATGGLPGQIHINCTHGQTNAARIDHNNIVNNVGGTMFALDGGWGLLDHNLYNTNGNAYSLTQLGGDFASSGYLDWQQATNLGSAEGWIFEDNNFNTTNSASALNDGQYGCKLTIRHNQFNGMPGGQVHGTDSGGYRGCVLVELYNNKFTSIAIGFSPWNGSRSGVVLFHDNVLTGTSVWNGIHVDFFRGSSADFGVAGSFGITCTNCNWTPINTSQNVINPQAPAWATGSHAANSIVVFGGCNMWTAAGGTSSGSTPSCPSLGSTVTDSGGVIWENIGGSTSAPPGSTGTNAGFLSTDNETTCTSGATCTRFFDTNAANSYPGRDQPGIIHSQCLYGSYQWNNSGSQIPSNFWSTDAPTYEQLGRDFFNSSPGTNCSQPAYTPYIYPDPLNGGAPPAPSPVAPAVVIFAKSSILSGEVILP